MKTSTPSERRRSPYLKALDLLRMHLHNSKFADLVYGTEVSNTNAAILDLHMRQPNATIGELADILGLNKSTVSRGWSTLEKQGLVRVRTAAIDRRKLVVKLLQPGKDFLQLHRNFTFSQVNLQSRRLKSGESKRLARYLRSFSDGADAPSLTEIEGEPEIRREFLRLTFAHGVISGNYLGSGYTAAQWLILSEIHYENRKSSDLQELLGIPQSSLSLRLRRLRSLELLGSKKGVKDGRERVLSVTPRGRKALRDIEKYAEKNFEESLSALSQEDLRDFLTLLKSYVGPELHPGEVFITPQVILGRARQQKTVQQLRKMYIQKLVTDSSVKEIPGSLFSENNELFSLRTADRLVGGFEFEKEPSNDIQLLNSFIDRTQEKELGNLDIQSAFSRFFPGQRVVDQVS